MRLVIGGNIILRGAMRAPPSFPTIPAIMTSRQASSWSAIASALREAVTGILVASLLVATGGCLQDADDKDYDFDNPNDTTPSDNDDDDTSGSLAIALVMELDDIVIIINQTTADRDLDGWALTNAAGTEEFLFPAFDLGQGDFVRAHTKDVSGTDSANDLYATDDGMIDWGGVNDTALLVDDTGDPVSDCDDTETCWP